MALAAHAVLQNRVLEALAFILGFLTYLRPGALVGLSAASLIPPTPLLGRATWGIVVSPTEEGKPTKTGEWDQSLLLDNPDFDWTAFTCDSLHAARTRQGGAAATAATTESKITASLAAVLAMAEHVYVLCVHCDDVVLPPVRRCRLTSG